MVYMQATKRLRPMYASLFVPNTMVGTKEHRMEYRALAAGCMTLSAYQQYRKTH